MKYDAQQWRLLFWGNAHGMVDINVCRFMYITDFPFRVSKKKIDYLNSKKTDNDDSIKRR